MLTEVIRIYVSIFLITTVWFNHCETKLKGLIPNFIKVPDTSLNSDAILYMLKKRDLSACVKLCQTKKICKSFEWEKKNNNCKLMSTDASKTPLKYKSGVDYYQSTIGKNGIIALRGTSLFGYDQIKHMDISFEECVHACKVDPGCNSFEYRLSDRYCDTSNITHYDHGVTINRYGWNFFEQSELNIRCHNSVKKVSSQNKLISAFMTPEMCEKMC